MAMTVETFMQNIIEYSQPFFFAEPEILIQHDPNWNLAGLQIFNTLDNTSWVIFLSLLLLTLCLLVIMDKTIASSFPQSLSNALLIIFGVIFGKGQ